MCHSMLNDCNRTVTSEPCNILDNWSKARIFAVMELANKWEFGRVKDKLVNELAHSLRNGTPLFENCVDEILLLHEYSLHSLFLPAYIRLAKRKRLSLRKRGRNWGSRSPSRCRLSEKNICRRSPRNTKMLSTLIGALS